MANSYGRMRTNYFRTTDLEALKRILKRCSTDGEKIELFERQEHGENLYAFGCEFSFRGYFVSGSDEWDFDSFTTDLQKVVAEKDSVIVFEIGYEKIKWLYSEATIITAERIKSLEMPRLARECAADMLGNKDYFTQIEY